MRGHTSLVLKRKPGDNVVLVGNNPNARHGLLLSVISSVALNLGQRDTRFALIDRTHAGFPVGEEVAATWQEQFAVPAGVDCRLVTEPAATRACCAKLATELDARRAPRSRARAERPAIFLALLDADRLESLARKPDAYGAAQESPAGALLAPPMYRGSAGRHPRPAQRRQRTRPGGRWWASAKAW